VSALDHPSIVRAERDGMAGIDDEATVLELEATYADVPLAVVARRRGPAVLLEVGREVRVLELAEANRVAAALIAAVSNLEPWVPRPELELEQEELHDHEPLDLAHQPWPGEEDAS
jgi:hypothetical protein